MFGSNDNDNTAQTDQTTAPAADSGTTDQVAMTSEAPSYLPSVPSAPATDDSSDVSSGGSSDDAALDSLVTASDDQTAEETPQSVNSDSSSDSGTPASSDDLIKLKQQALQQLTPLVGHLEQSAEDRFRTFMMMIQASDDNSLIPKAYEAAQQIEDEKVKAQALLDVVNEINYFTQQEQKSEQD